MTLALRQIPSPNYGGSRGQILWIIVHTAEGALTVDNLGSFFANPASGVSSHVGIDDHGIAQYVPYSGQAWTARSANPNADQAELCGFAAWTRAQWLTHGGMLENTAQWIADRCTARGIPAVKISPADVGAHKPGVIGHIDITLGLHDGTHTDPGPSFPWDVVMARVNEILTGGTTDMPLTDADVQKIWWAETKDPATGQPVQIIQLLKNAELAAANAARDAAIARKLAEQAAAGVVLTGAEIDAIAAQVAADLATGYKINVVPPA